MLPQLSRNLFHERNKHSKKDCCKKWKSSGFLQYQVCLPVILSKNISLFFKRITGRHAVHQTKLYLTTVPFRQTDILPHFLSNISDIHFYSFISMFIILTFVRRIHFLLLRLNRQSFYLSEIFAATIPVFFGRFIIYITHNLYKNNTRLDTFCRRNFYGAMQLHINSP